MDLSFRYGGSYALFKKIVLLFGLCVQITMVSGVDMVVYEIRNDMLITCLYLNYYK